MRSGLVGNYKQRLGIPVRHIYVVPVSIDEAMTLARHCASFGRYDDAGWYASCAARLANDNGDSKRNIFRLYAISARYWARAALLSPVKFTSQAVAAAETADYWRYRMRRETWRERRDDVGAVLGLIGTLLRHPIDTFNFLGGFVVYGLTEQERAFRKRRNH